MPLGPFWEQPRDGDLQGSGCGRESRGVAGHGLLWGGTSGLDCDGKRVDDSSQSRRTLLGGAGGWEGGPQEATMVQEARTFFGWPQLLWARLGHRAHPRYRLHPLPGLPGRLMVTYSPLPTTPPPSRLTDDRK